MSHSACWRLYFTVSFLLPAKSWKALFHSGRWPQTAAMKSCNADPLTVARASLSRGALLPLPVARMVLSPLLHSSYFAGAAPVVAICRFSRPSLLAQKFACLLTMDFDAEPLVMVVAGISIEPLFTVVTFFAVML